VPRAPADEDPGGGVPGTNLSPGAMKRPPREAAFSFPEPVSLSSTLPGNLPLAGTAPGSRFDLLALRARCKREPRPRGRAPQELRKRAARKLGVFRYACVEWGFFQRATAARAGPRRAPDWKEFAEPEALSSAFPGDVPLPRTASREGFDLPGAPCSAHSAI
jgi:hypothetical protein